MNSIQLTEEHKSKLLEMCKDLFPKYKVKFIPDNLLEYDDQIFNYLSIEEITEKEVDFTVIHWFEFCMTNLVASLVKLDNLSNRIWREVWNELNGGPMVGIKKHPTDYLYNEFKKLK